MELHSRLGPGRASCSHTCHHAQKDSMLVWCSAVTILKFVMIFEQGGLHYFALGPAKCPGWVGVPFHIWNGQQEREAEMYLFALCFHLPSSSHRILLLSETLPFNHASWLNHDNASSVHWHSFLGIWILRSAPPPMEQKPDFIWGINMLRPRRWSPGVSESLPFWSLMPDTPFPSLPCG